MIHALFRSVWLCGLICVAIQGSSRIAAAKKPKGTPAPASENEGQQEAEKPGVQARLRLWKACDPSTSVVQVVFAPEKGGVSPFTFVADTSGFQFTNYQNVPAAAGIVTVTLEGKPPVRLPVNLSDGGDSTVLVQVRNGGLSTRMINDTPVAEEAGATFKTFNLLAGNSGDVQVALGDVLNMHFSVPGASSRMGGLKPAVYPVIVSGTDTDGKTFKWSTEADLRKHRHATLLIYPDGYGRIRPRLIEDGQPADPPAKAAASKSQE